MTTQTRTPIRGLPRWEKLVAEQEQWVRDCGGDLEGYILNYHMRSVENATAIYNADTAALEYRREELSFYSHYR